MSLAQLPPQNLDAEESVLGAILLGGGLGLDTGRKVLARVRETLDVADFYRESHAKIYCAALALCDRGEPVDAIAVASELQARGELEDAGGRVRIHELAALVPATSNVSHYAQIVRTAARRRREGLAAEALARASVNGGLATDPKLRDELLDLLAGERSEDRFALSVETARELGELPEPPATDLLLGPLVVRGQRTLMAAATGEGKTTFVLQAVKTILAGGDFLGYAGQGGEQRVLYIDAEQGLRTIKRRLREVGLAECDQLDYVRVPDGLSLDANPGHIAELERVLRDGGYTVVVADPIYKLFSGDSNEERAAVDLMRRFDRWRSELHFGLVVPSHTRKPVVGSRFTINELFGSSAFARGAEVVLGLQRVRDGYAKLHFWKDRDGDLPIGAKWGLLYDRDGGFRRDPKESEPSTRERVAELRAADPEMTQKQVSKAIGVTERTVSKYWKDDPEEVQTALLDDEDE